MGDILESFQTRVVQWMKRAGFPVEIISSSTERNYRFLEEALELVQANGLNEEDAHKMVEYVFNREKGEVGQEVGGVLITLAALCDEKELDMCLLGEGELARVNNARVIDQIKTKHKEKTMKVM